MDDEIVQIASTSDIVAARHRGRELARSLGFTVLEQTRLATAISELARNVVQHAGTGECRIRAVRELRAARVEVVVEDHGPGIANLQQALLDGFSTGGSMGVGLPGTRRLVTEFHIESEPGLTVVRIAIVRQQAHG